MQPTNFPQKNFVFTKPQGWSEEQCQDLPVYRGRDQNGNPIVISKWKLDDAEIEKINETRSVYMMCVSDYIPPASLHVHSPFNSEAATTEQSERQIVCTVNLKVTAKDTFISVNFGGVPKSLILEALSQLTQDMANELVVEALQEVPQEGVEGYMNGRLKQDREIVANELKKEFSTPGKIITLSNKIIT